MAQFNSAPAWTKIATKLDGMTDVRAAVDAAGLGFTASKRPLMLSDGELVKSHVAVTRDDTQQILGVIGRKRSIVDPGDAFAVLQPLVDSGELSLVSAGSGRKHRVPWIMGKINGATLDVDGKGDTIESYMLFVYSFDASIGTQGKILDFRMFCANQMARAQRSGTKFFSMRMTGKAIAQRLEAIRGAFHQHQTELADGAAIFQRLLTKKLSAKNARRYVREVLSPGAGNDDDKTVRNVDDVLAKIETGRGAVPGTLWGGYNAITEWATHDRGRSAETRVDANFFGAGSNLIQRALDVAVEYGEKLPDLRELGSESYANHATAKADFDALLGKPLAAAI